MAKDGRSERCSADMSSAKKRHFLTCYFIDVNVDACYLNFLCCLLSIRRCRRFSEIHSSDILSSNDSTPPLEEMNRVWAQRVNTDRSASALASLGVIRSYGCRRVQQLPPSNRLLGCVCVRHSLSLPSLASLNLH